MTTAIEQLKAAKIELGYSTGWAEMLGKQYHGGGGGIGRLVRLSLRGGDRPTIYYQHRNGDTNYHPAPLRLTAHLEDAIADRFPEILKDALARHQAEVKALAEHAVEEHRALLADAGLEV